MKNEVKGKGKGSKEDEIYPFEGFLF